MYAAELLGAHREATQVITAVECMQETAMAFWVHTVNFLYYLKATLSK